MISLRIKDATRVIGKSQGYLGLAVRDLMTNDTVNGPDTPAMETAWEPTPDELQRIAVGAPIILRILGTMHPPVMVEVGPTPDLVPHPKGEGG